MDFNLEPKWKIISKVAYYFGGISLVASVLVAICWELYLIIVGEFDVWAMYPFLYLFIPASLLYAIGRITKLRGNNVWTIGFMVLLMLHLARTILDAIIIALIMGFALAFGF